MEFGIKLEINLENWSQDESKKEILCHRISKG
jgi:hypothetical protein